MIVKTSVTHKTRRRDTGPSPVRSESTVVDPVGTPDYGAPVCPRRRNGIVAKQITTPPHALLSGPTAFWPKCRSDPRRGPCLIGELGISDGLQSSRTGMRCAPLAAWASPPPALTATTFSVHRCPRRRAVKGNIHPLSATSHI